MDATSYSVNYGPLLRRHFLSKYMKLCFLFKREYQISQCQNIEHRRLDLVARTMWMSQWATMQWVNKRGWKWINQVIQCMAAFTYTHTHTYPIYEHHYRDRIPTFTQLNDRHLIHGFFSFSTFKLANLHLPSTHHNENETVNDRQVTDQPMKGNNLFSLSSAQCEMNSSECNGHYLTCQYGWMESDTEKGCFRKVKNNAKKDERYNVGGPYCESYLISFCRYIVYSHV